MGERRRRPVSEARREADIITRATEEMTCVDDVREYVARRLRIIIKRAEQRGAERASVTKTPAAAGEEVSGG